MELQIKLLGDKKVANYLNQVGVKFGGRLLKAAVLAGALKIRNRAALNAPFITGTLKRSIHVGGHVETSPGFNPGEGYSDIKGEIVSPNQVELKVGTNLVYAARVHYGFTGKDKLGRIYNQPENPYLESAFETEKEAAIKEVEDAIISTIEAF